VSGQTLEIAGIDKQPETFSPLPRPSSLAPLFEKPLARLRPSSLAPHPSSLAPRPSMQVRLVGIDAPDLQQQPWGQAAKERLEVMIEGRPVLLEFDVQDKDTFGRRLAYVWQDGVLLNEKLVKEGYVLWVARSPNHKYDQRLARAQEWARLMGLGVWNPEQPMRLTPAEFRRSRGEG